MTGIGRRVLGSTRIEVAELGLGAMDTPTSKEGPDTFKAALDLGIDFVDTAREYSGSEFLIGEEVRARGTKDFVVASKTFSHNIDGSQRDVDRSMAMLGVDKIDVYQLHDISTPQAWEEVMAEEGALAGLRVAQYRGLVDHVGISSHSDEIVRRAIESDEFDTVMLEYSAFFPGTSELIDLASEHDVGVIVMRPLGGSGRTSAMRGLISEGYGGPLTPAALLRYVLSHPGVSVAIPGARYPSRIHENVATVQAYEPMGAAERRELERAAAELY